MLKTMTVRATIAAILAGLSMSAHAIADSPQPVDIPAGDLRQALLMVSEQFGTDLVFSPEQIQGFKTGGAHGHLTTEQAVTKLLEGTPLELRTDPSGAMLIAPPAASKATVVRQEENTAQSPRVIELEEVVVTGTHIRGTQPSAPVLSVTQEEMRLAGHHNLGDAIRALPQNFSGGQNPGVIPASGAGAANQENRNISGASSINLRGLGSGATLVLLNGSRLPYNGFRQAADVSAIPVAAIERMEVLFDGASAIYGSDAIGGVVNIILRRDYQGAGISARYGEATDGGYTQNQYTAVGGTNWGSGGFLVTGDVSRNSAVAARERSYLSHLPQPYDIYPAVEQEGGVVSGRQRIGESLEIVLDGFYTQRDQKLWTQSSATSRIFEDPESSVWGVSPSLRLDLPGEWSADLRGSFGRDVADFHSRSFAVSTGLQNNETKTGYENEGWEAGAGAQGQLFRLPAGAVQVAIGGGYRKNEFEEINRLTGATRVSGSRHSYYAYGEVRLPIVSASQGIPLVNTLTFNAAGRYEDYDDFGDVTSPKVGVLWNLTPDVGIKSSWGKSFKTPTLTEQLSTQIASLFPGAVFPGLPAGSTVLFMQGGNPALGPERAEILTAGIAFHPRALAGFDLEANWFSIDYTDRVVPPVTSITQAFSNPAFSDFVALAPSAATQAELIAGAQSFTNNAGTAYDPARVYGVVFNRNTNVARERAHGVDLLVSYSVDVLGGRLTANSNGSWIKNRRKITSRAPEVATSGVVYFPVEFRGRLGASWSHGGFTFASHLNHLKGETNDRVTPNHEVASMTTVDVVLDYHWASTFLGDVELNLAGTNVFDRSPPFARTTSPAIFIPYDPANYSALGRVISASVTKRF